MENSEKKHKISVTIIVSGLPEIEEYPKSMKVEEIIKKSLPEHEKRNWSDYQLSDKSTPLDPNKSLEENGVEENDILSLTKKDGGGGLM
ncbi:MAG: hypothetical protein HYV24_06690 [Deltaproteobacteria bacterium]|nr:hypothetical protein [Deltaproteobacteria bacterium]